LHRKIGYSLLFRFSNVPNLRFPEFTGEWEWHKLGDIADISKGSGISKDQLSEQGQPCILYGELYTKYKSEIIRKIISRTDIDNRSLVRSQTNDVVIPSSGETAIDIATARYIPFSDILLGGDLNIIRLKRDNGGFLSYQLNGIRKRDIAKVAQGVSVIHLYGDSLKKLDVAICSPEEQSKIISFLSLLDKRIETQNKIIEDLKLLKSTIRNLLFKALKKVNSETRTVRNALDYEQPAKYIVESADYHNDSTLTPVLTANKAFVLGYTSENYGIYDKGECIIFDDFTMDMKYVDFPFKVKSSAIKILTSKPGTNLRYIFEYLSFLNLTSSDHKRHYISEVESMPIYISEIDVQDRFSNLFSFLDKKIEIELHCNNLFIKQKQYLLRHLFV